MICRGDLVCTGVSLLRFEQLIPPHIFQGEGRAPGAASIQVFEAAPQTSRSYGNVNQTAGTRDRACLASL